MGLPPEPFSYSSDSVKLLQAKKKKRGGGIFSLPLLFQDLPNSLLQKTNYPFSPLEKKGWVVRGLSSSLPLYLLEVSWGQTERCDRASQGLGTYSQSEWVVTQFSYQTPPHQPVGSHVSSGWNITSELGIRTRSAHFRIRQTERPPAPKPNVFGAKTQFREASSLRGLSCPTLLIHLCGVKILIHEHIGNYISILLTRNVRTTKSST